MNENNTRYTTRMPARVRATNQDLRSDQLHCFAQIEGTLMQYPLCGHPCCALTTFYIHQIEIKVSLLTARSVKSGCVANTDLDLDPVSPKHKT